MKNPSEFVAVLDGKKAKIAHYRWSDPDPYPGLPPEADQRADPNYGAKRSLCSLVVRPLQFRGHPTFRHPQYDHDDPATFGAWVDADPDMPVCSVCVGVFHKLAAADDGKPLPVLF